MSTDNLDTLPDSDLSALFAVEVVGSERFDGNADRFATSADAVLPWLEKWSHCWAVDREPTEDYYVVLGHPELDAFEATAPTFARAACIALIRAKRATNHH